MALRASSHSKSYPGGWQAPLASVRLLPSTGGRRPVVPNLSSFCLHLITFKTGRSCHRRRPWGPILIKVNVANCVRIPPCICKIPSVRWQSQVSSCTALAMLSVYNGQSSQSSLTMFYFCKVHIPVVNTILVKRLTSFCFEELSAIV